MLAGMLLMDVKGVFNRINRNCLLRTMENMGADGDLMCWTESFILGRCVVLVIDRH